MTTDKSSEREALIKAMVDRFLGWKLPKSFGPDGGVSFERTVNGAPREHDSHWWPIGTNLFTATEARAMVEHMLGDVPSVDDFPPCGALHEARAALPQQSQETSLPPQGAEPSAQQAFASTPLQRLRGAAAFARSTLRTNSRDPSDWYDDVQTLAGLLERIAADLGQGAIGRHLIENGYLSGHMVSEEAAADLLAQFDALAASPAPAPQEPAASPFAAHRVADLVKRLRDSSGSHINGLYDREAADALEEMAQLADSEGSRAVKYLRRARKAESLLYASPAPGELRAVDASEGWISVDDRMPEPDSGEVLVWLSGGRCAFDEWHMHREDPTGMSTTHTMEMGLMWRDYEFEDITHWMPLPQPPQQAPSESSAQGSGGEKV